MSNGKESLHTDFLVAGRSEHSDNGQREKKRTIAGGGEKEKKRRKNINIHNLGPANLSSRDVLPPPDFKIRVKRQDSSQHLVSLMEELYRFTHNHFPKWDQEHLHFPLAFSYNTKKLQGREGPTDVTGQDDQWATAVKSIRGEELLDQNLHKVFKNRVSMRWNNYETRTLLNLSRACRGSGNFWKPLKEHVRGEFDNFVVDQDSRTFLHFEVKTYPQEGEDIEKEILERKFYEVKGQHDRGDILFSSVLCPSARLSEGWRKINLACFPNIRNREAFKIMDETLEDSFAKYILTENELTGDQWMRELDLRANESDKEEYKRLLAIIIGPSYVSCDSQVFDYQVETIKSFKRVVGDKAVGTGTVPDALPDKISTSDLKNRPLGHVNNIIFWNDEQMELLSDLKSKNMSILLYGEYGVGKTSLLLAAAQNAAEDGFEAIFVSCAEKSSAVINVALKEKLSNIRFEVASFEGISSRNIAVVRFIKKFEGNKKVKFFFDEFPTSPQDYDLIQEDCSLVRVLRAIDKNSCQSLVSLCTERLLDACNMREEAFLKAFDRYIEKKSKYAVKRLKLRMRNSANIGEASELELNEGYVHWRDSRRAGGRPTWPAFQTPMGLRSVRNVLGLSQRHTIPGERPVFLQRTVGQNNQVNVINGVNGIAYSLQFALTELLHVDQIPAGKLAHHIVVLCAAKIPPEEVFKSILYLNIQPCLYEGRHNEPELVEWLNGPGGILVTRDILFQGMEAATVIYLSDGRSRRYRNWLLRAVAKLIVVSPPYPRERSLPSVLEEHYDVKYPDEI